MTTIQNKYKACNILLILESIGLATKIVINMVGFGAQSIIGMFLTIIAIVVIVGLSVKVLNCYENLTHVKKTEDMENDIQVLFTQNIIIAVALGILFI